MQEAAHESEARYRTLFETLIEGFCTIEMIFDANREPVDYRFLEINPAFERQTGLRIAQAGIDAFLAAHAQKEPFHAVITDLGMPYVDGRQVCAAIKTAAPSTIVIMLTGWGQRFVAEGGAPLHIDSVLSKPPKLRELREALARGLHAAP